MSLQYDKDRVDADIARQHVPAQIFYDEEIDVISDIDSHYAQIAAMDAIVTIDCSVVHFAGSLGKPTAMFINSAPAWKWYPAEEAGFLHENQSLFYQELTGRWSRAFQGVRGWLESIVSHPDRG